MSHDPVVQLRLLGAFACTRDGETVNVTGRLRSVLAVLAMADGEPVSVERLTTGVWGDDPPADPRRALQVYVNRLRNQLGSGVVTTHPAGYRLAADRVEVDAVEFLRLATRATAEGDVDDRSELTHAALELWAGDPFDSIPTPRLREVDGPRLVEARLRLVEQRFDLTMQQRPDRAVADSLIAELTELTRRHPLREPIWARLLAALSTAGRGAEALERYEEVRTLLAEELGTDPGRELQSMHARLLDDDVVLVGVPQQLLPDLPYFIGRTSAMTELDERLIEGRGMAVALTGIGGTGKTSLAMHWAHVHANRYPDGQLYVDLNGFSAQAPLAPIDALEQLLRGLGVSTELLPNSVSERSALFRTELSGRRTLVVLDNASDATQVRPLLPGASSQAIITSRNQLRGMTARDGVHAVALEPFGRDEATRLLTSIAGPARVTRQPDAAAEVVELCGRLPLAVAITAERAARMASTELADVAAELRDERQRLRHLAAGDDERSDLRAVFELSYARLEPESALLFRYLSLLPHGPFDIASVVALTGFDRGAAGATLDGLVAGHLVQQSAPGEYWLHDLLRVYAGDRCRADDGAEAAAAAVAAACAWVLANLNAAVATLRPLGSAVPPPDGVAARPAAELVEFDRVAAVLDWFRPRRSTLIDWVRRAEDHGLVDLVWRLDSQLSILLEITEQRADAAALADLSVAAVEGLDDPIATYVAHAGAGRAYTRVRRYDDAGSALDVALEAARTACDPDAESTILAAVGVLRRLTGDPDEAYRLNRRALGLLPAADGNSLLPASETVIRMNLGGCYYERHEFAAATEATRAALECARVERDHWRAAVCLNNLTVMYEVADDYAAANEAFNEVVPLVESLGAPALAFNAQTAKGRMLAADGDLAGAVEVWEYALSLLPALDNPQRTEVIELLADTRARLG